MASPWQETLLGDVLTLQRGFDLPSHKRQPGPVAVVSSSGVTGTHFEARVSAPGVVTGRYGTLGEVFFLEHDFWPLNTTLYVRDFKGNDPKFIYYLLQSVEFSAFNDKSSVPGLNRNHLHGQKVPFTGNLPEQRAIAHILGTLDDKIELNRRMNQTLEEIARAIFKSWFIDFDPVRAKAAGRQPEGMDAETAALFPNAFVDSELGEIPTGWRVGALADLARVARNSVNPSLFPEESFHHYSIPAFDNGKMPTADLGQDIKSNKTLVEPDAILISKLNPHIPRVWLPVVAMDRRSICSTEFLVVVPEQGDTRSFIYALFTSELFTHTFASMVTGTTGSHQRVSREGLLGMRVVIPSQSVIGSFNALSGSLFNRMAANQRESITLASLRDLILPELLSGRLHTPTPMHGQKT